MRSLLLLLACAACGSVEGNKPDAAVTTNMDAMIDGAGSGSAAPCDVTKAFGTPTLVLGINTTDQGGQQRWGYLSGDLLTMYFSDIPASNRNIYIATRGSTSAAFGAAQQLGAVNTTANEEHPAVTSDGLILVMDTAAFNQTYDIAMATRQFPAQQWSSINPVSNVNTNNFQEVDSWISFDGLTLLIGSNRTNNEYGIYMSTRTTTTGTFTTPALISELDDPAAVDSGGVLSADKLEIFFYSDRTGGSGQSDIYHATRSSPSAAFGTPTPVTELDSANIELMNWLSPDRCTVVFSSDRLGTYDIWMATRPQ
jgi:hypothetical protein